jgi:hemerythrin superfamily protein
MPNPIEQFVAKTAGKVGAVAARSKGLTGVFNKLAEQHKEAEAILLRISTVDDVMKRQDLWSTVRRELLSHERAELATVYPVIEQHEATRDIADRHGLQADTLDAAIGEIDIVGCDSPNFKPLIERLITLVRHHVEEEENEFFPRAEEALGKEGAADLEGPFMAARERILETMP